MTDIERIAKLETQLSIVREEKNEYMKKWRSISTLHEKMKERKENSGAIISEYRSLNKKLINDYKIIKEKNRIISKDIKSIEKHTDRQAMEILKLKEMYKNMKCLYMKNLKKEL